MSMYSNFPIYGNSFWVFGNLNKETEFLFFAQYGDLYLDNGNRAWNRTDFERAVKQKCRKLKKEKGYTYFYIDDLGDMHNRVRKQDYLNIKNFPMYKYLQEKK